jgi:hypothetical protein
MHGPLFSYRETVISKYGSTVCGLPSRAFAHMHSKNASAALQGKDHPGPLNLFHIATRHGQGKEQCAQSTEASPYFTLKSTDASPSYSLDFIIVRILAIADN